MKYFSIKRTLFVVHNQKCCEEFDKIDKFMQLLENSGVGKIVANVKYKDKNYKGRNGYNSFNLFAAIIYCFMRFKATLRDIEDKFIFDLRVIYIMENNLPKHTVIGDFINKYILPYQYEIFTMITKTIIEELNVITDIQYNDGTKIEANANKYKFVWKPTTYHKKLDIKIRELLLQIGIEIKDKKLIKSFQFNELLKEYIIRENIDVDSIPTGKGKRLSKEQKNYKLAYQYLIKLLEYEEKEATCGENRNSYYKTDKAATAMVLKEDYYSRTGHDFHAGYNIQVMVSSGIITMYGVFQNRDDFYTFIPMNDLYYKYYNKHPKNECADSGYGMYENYKYMKEHNIKNYVKHYTWSGEADGKRPQLFYTFDDGIMCLNTCIGKEISFEGIRHPRYKNSKLYKFVGCNNCNYSYICKKNLKNKTYDYRLYELIPEYELLKEEARKNLQSPKGIEVRINRSIQVEGAFGQIKNNMNYDRIRRRGLKKVSCEIMLMCLGANIRKYFSTLDGSNLKDNYWNTSSNLKEEKFPYVKPQKKKLSRN